MFSKLFSPSVLEEGGVITPSKRMEHYEGHCFILSKFVRDGVCRNDPSVIRPTPNNTHSSERLVCENKVRTR